jgi:hypothetical protein
MPTKNPPASKKAGRESAAERPPHPFLAEKPRMRLQESGRWLCRGSKDAGVIGIDARAAYDGYVRSLYFRADRIAYG